MLYRLEIENFYSIRDRQVLDLCVSEKAPPKPERFAPIHPGAAERAPKVVAMFGANGAGKTNTLRALAFIAWFVRDSFQLKPESAIPVIGFQDREESERETRLAVAFGGTTDLIAPNSSSSRFGTYEYELVMGGLDFDTRVVRESLRHRVHGSRRSFRVFERNETGEVLDGETFSLVHYRSAIAKIRSNASVVSMLAQFEHGPSLALRRLANSVLANVGPAPETYNEKELAATFAGNRTLIESINRDISRIDLGIRELKIATGGLLSVLGEPGPRMEFIHEGVAFPIHWPLESHGTQSFVRTFPLIARALESGGIAVVDELDASLHPMMLAEIVRWFHDRERNPKDAQLWLTCQNASLLEELEKEEVAFCEKDGRGRTALYGLQDVRNVRRVDNYYRKYLSGAYGAVPTIG